MYIKDALGRDLSIVKFTTTGSTTTSATEYFVHGTDRVARVTVGTNIPLAKIKPDEVTYFLYDHLANTRVAFMTDSLSVPLIVNALDYYSYGKILREYDNGAGDRYLTTGHERDKATGLDYRGARYYDSDVARFLSLDPLAAKYPSFSSYNYVMANPIRLTDPDGRSTKDLIVTTMAGEELFTLDDGKTEKTKITAKALYKKGVQWFEPLANNYMALKSKSSTIGSTAALKHFSWGDITSFASEDLYLWQYQQGYAGDWKKSEDGADGDFIVTVGGDPYWADAVGQIPFAIDAYTDFLVSGKDFEKAVYSTVYTGEKYGSGELVGGTADFSNSYDNYMILRGALWAAHNHKLVDGKAVRNDITTRVEISKPISVFYAKKYLSNLK
nr:RHS repeat-associated core domain-containing protein [uncultured Fluviicola sp.]